MATEQFHQATLEEISCKLDTLEILLLDLCGKRKRQDPHFVRWDEAARLSGLSVEALRTRLRREDERPDGVTIKRIWGALDRKDFQAWLDRLTERRPTTGQIARRALERIIV